jgi:hypothetical protein
VVAPSYSLGGWFHGGVGFRFMVVFVVVAADFCGGSWWFVVVDLDPYLDSDLDLYLWWLLRKIWHGFSLRLSSISFITWFVTPKLH